MKTVQFIHKGNILIFYGVERRESKHHASIRLLEGGGNRKGFSPFVSEGNFLKPYSSLGERVDETLSSGLSLSA